MLRLKKNIGRLEVKGLGITLTQAAPESILKRAIEQQPSIAQFCEEVKDSKSKTDGKDSK